jgi:hypothetical protein
MEFIRAEYRQHASGVVHALILWNTADGRLEQHAPASFETLAAAEAWVGTERAAQEPTP